MKCFKIGVDYVAADPMVPTITVTGRTKRYIQCYNFGGCWQMKIRYDQDGNEMLIDSSVPKRLRDMYTYNAAREAVR